MTSDDALDATLSAVTDDLVIDLLEDPREVTGVLGSFLPTVPVARSAPDLAVAAARLDGYGEYGS